MKKEFKSMFVIGNVVCLFYLMLVEEKIVPKVVTK